MQHENKSVVATCMVEITPAQMALLDLIKLLDPKEVKRSLRHVKEFVLYLGGDGVEVCKKDLDSCYIVNNLEQAIGKVAKENKPLNALSL